MNKEYLTLQTEDSFVSIHIPATPNTPLPESPVQCWACWDTDLQHEMIRPCLGCKNKHLKYIHQSCMQKYIREHLLRQHPSYIIEETVPYLSQTTIQELKEVTKEGKAVMSSRVCDFMPLKCTRCCDEYTEVYFKPVSPFKVLVSDRPLLILLILMTISLMLVLCTFLYMTSLAIVPNWVRNVTAVLSLLYVLTAGLVYRVSSGYSDISATSKLTKQ